MAEMVLRKRAAMHPGEIGLFLDTEVFAEEFGHIKMNCDVEIKATQPRSLRQLRFAWALARKVAESGALGDVDQTDAMDWLKMKCRHVRYVTNIHSSGTDTIVVPKSIRFAAMDQTAFQRLMNRMIYVIATEVLPDVPEGVLRAEIEDMAGVGVPDPEPAKPPRQRKPRAMPAPVSVIPATEPVNASDVPSSPVQPAPEGPPPEALATNPVPAPTSPARPALGWLAPAERTLSPPPAPSAGSAPLTKDFDGWKVYCLAWLDAYRADPEKTDQDCLVRWNAERALRNECGITSEERQPVSEVYLTIVEEKRKGKPI